MVTAVDLAAAHTTALPAPGAHSALVQRCQAGDQNAFSELFNLYWRDAVGVARHVIRDPALAEDVAQEAFIKVYRRIGGFGFRSQFRSWLYRVVVNQAISTLRRRVWQERPQAGYDQLTEGWVPRTAPLEELVVEADERSLVRQMVNRLRTSQRLLIHWKYYAGLTDEQIASRIDCPVGTVKSRLHRARRQLSHALGGQVDQR